MSSIQDYDNLIILKHRPFGANSPYFLPGHRYDKHGDMTKWMSDNSSKNIRRNHACLEKSYGNLAFRGRKFGRVRDYREQFCDIGGINLAFEVRILRL